MGRARTLIEVKNEVRESSCANFRPDPRPG